MDLNAYPTAHAQVASRIVDGSAIIVLADSGQVNVLNAVGTRIWELVDGTHTVQEIADTVAAEFEVTLQEAQRDAEEFLAELMKSQAIVFRERPSD